MPGETPGETPGKIYRQSLNPLNFNAIVLLIAGEFQASRLLTFAFLPS
jgi:hypothetical protein